MEQDYTPANRGLQHCGAGLHPCKIGDYITVARRRREKNSIFEGVSPLKTVFLHSQNAQNLRLRRAKLSIPLRKSEIGSSHSTVPPSFCGEIWPGRGGTVLLILLFAEEMVGSKPKSADFLLATLGFLLEPLLPLLRRFGSLCCL